MTTFDAHTTEWSIAALRHRAAVRLRPQPCLDQRPPQAGDRGDFDLNGGHTAFAHLLTRPPRPAAVLIPIIDRREPMVLLTVRPTTMTEHAGQIALPGGRAAAGDTSPLETALREAHEEVGLAPCDVACIGYLDPYRTGTGYLITPVVAIVDGGFVARPDPREVADAFEVPLAFLMARANHRMDQRTINGKVRQFHAMPYEHRYIWGATAGILKMLHERLTGP